MADLSYVYAQRRSALLNGVIIGAGINGLIMVGPYAIFPLAVGIFLEWRARSGLEKEK